ncbi:hypothetical protein ADG881_408 [Alcanivorax sp. DG881]|jgi:hypothetical protein|nr:hypothetical protein ADG881_408 [Alcanivorax sp. DG881]
MIATLLATTLMVVSSLLSANTLTMAMSTATDSPMTPSSMTHCHHSADTPNGDMTAGHDMAQMQACEGSDSCQCITLCQITAASDTAFVANAFIPSPPGTDSLITTIHAGIHRLPLRPPSLSV